MRKTAVLWVRVSSEPQSRGYTPAEYEHRAVAAAKGLGLDVVKIFSVTESAKTSEERKHFREMVEFVKANGVGFIVAEDIDRITRNYRDTYTMQELIDAHGVGVHFVATGRTIDKNSPPQDHFVFTIMAGWAQLDNRQRGVKTRTGMEGKVPRTGLPCLARRSDTMSPPPLHFWQEEADRVGRSAARPGLVREAFELYDGGGYSIKSLLAEMTRRGLRTKPTSREPNSPLTKHAVERMLKNPFYHGEFTWSGQVWKGEPQADHRPGALRLGAGEAPQEVQLGEGRDQALRRLQGPLPLRLLRLHDDGRGPQGDDLLPLHLQQAVQAGASAPRASSARRTSTA